VSTYLVTWTEVSTHSVTISAETLAAIKGVSVDELAGMDSAGLEDGLDDDLAKLADDGFEGLAREGIDVMELA
jgi:hypothetical protein